MVDFSIAIDKMDKWAYDDSDAQNDFYDLINDETLSDEERISEMEDMLEEIVQDWDRLESYIDEEYTLRELAIALIEANR